MFICLVGIDGSGKTLQATRLVERLLKHGMQPDYVWCRYSPWVMRPVMLATKRVLRSRRPAQADEYQSFTSAKRGISRRPIVGMMWRGIALLEYTVQALVKVRSRLRSDRVLVCDRYVFDLLADMAVNFGYNDDRILALAANPFLKLLPVPDVVYYLDIPPDVALARKDDPNVMGKGYLDDRAAIYSYLCDRLGFKRIDGTQPIDQITDELLQDVLARRRVGAEGGPL